MDPSDSRSGIHQVHTDIDPTAIVRPELSGLPSPQGRKQLVSLPFGDDTP